VRWALLIGLAGQLLDISRTALPAISVLPQIAALLAAVAGCAAVPGEFAKLTYFRKLALRIPDEGMAQTAGTLRWVISISLGVVMLAGLGVVIVNWLGGLAIGSALTPGTATAPAGPSPGFLPVLALGLGCIVGLAGVVVLIASILVFILVERMAKAFRREAALARDNWAALEGGAAPAAGEVEP
jgi:hypothetical protein